MHPAKKRPSAAILANGAVPSHPVPLGIVRSADLLVCCDGACGTARSLGRDPDFAVGDGDSVSEAAAAALGDRFIRMSGQDTNDLEKAFDFTCGLEPSEISIIGATGLREDHCLRNIFLLFRFATRFPGVAMYTDSGRFDVVSGECRFACSPGDAVSFVTPDPETRASSEGLVWPLDAVGFDSLYRATLNRTSGDRFRISFDRPALMFRPYPGDPPHR